MRLLFCSLVGVAWVSGSTTSHLEQSSPVASAVSLETNVVAQPPLLTANVDDMKLFMKELFKQQITDIPLLSSPKVAKLNQYWSEELMMLTILASELEQPEVQGELTAAIAAVDEVHFASVIGKHTSFNKGDLSTSEATKTEKGQKLRLKLGRMQRLIFAFQSLRTHAAAMHMGDVEKRALLRLVRGALRLVPRITGHVRLYRKVSAILENGRFPIEGIAQAVITMEVLADLAGLQAGGVLHDLTEAIRAAPEPKTGIHSFVLAMTSSRLSVIMPRLGASRIDLNRAFLDLETRVLTGIRGVPADSVAETSTVENGPGNGAKTTRRRRKSLH
jgi:hypothetical protein